MYSAQFHLPATSELDSLRWLSYENPESTYALRVGPTWRDIRPAVQPDSALTLQYVIPYVEAAITRAVVQANNKQCTAVFWGVNCNILMSINFSMFKVS